MIADQGAGEQARERDVALAETLFAQFYPRIYRYLASLTDAQTAADLAQETFLRACIALPRLREHSQYSAWLFQIATNLARSHARRQRIIRWLPLNHSQKDAGNHANRIAERDLVDAALATLSVEQRTCLLLQIWAGMDGATIARTVGKSETAVRMMLSRARRQFRAAYQTLDADMENSDELR